jgi:1-deoxy-D-xylulose-5-phosphate synthase
MYDKFTGEIHRVKPESHDPAYFQDVFGYTLLELAKANEKIVGITPAMSTGCSMNVLMEEMPERAFDVGIAEQHAVTFSAGLASQGLVPFCNVYSTFMQRAYDQLIHDVALQKLPVVLCLDRGGLVGADGATHQGVYDLAYLRCIPNLIVSAPMTEIDLRNLMYTAQLKDRGPFAIRYPRGKGVVVNWDKPFEELEIGRAKCLRKGKDIAILTLGFTGNLASEAIRKLTAGDGIEVEHWDMRFLKPLDEECLHEVCKRFDKIITIEDGTISGGFGSAVLEFMADHGYQCKLKRLGVPDRFIDHGSQQELYRECGFDAESIRKEAQSLVKNRVLSKTA